MSKVQKAVPIFETYFLKKSDIKEYITKLIWSSTFSIYLLGVRVSSFTNSMHLLTGIYALCKIGSGIGGWD